MDVAYHGDTIFLVRHLGRLKAALCLSRCVVGTVDLFIAPHPRWVLRPASAPPTLRWQLKVLTRCTVDGRSVFGGGTIRVEFSEWLYPCRRVRTMIDGGDPISGCTVAKGRHFGDRSLATVAARSNVGERVCF
jgi:hypothetical protein